MAYIYLHIRSNVYCQVLFLSLDYDNEVEPRYKHLRVLKAANSGHVFGPNTCRKAVDHVKRHIRVNLEKNLILRFV